MFLRFRYTLAGAGVAGAVRISLPVSAESTQYPSAGYNTIGGVNLLDSGTANLYGMFDLDSTVGSGIVDVTGSAGSFANAGGLSSTSPFTWAVNDTITFCATYEAA